MDISQLLAMLPDADTPLEVDPEKDIFEAPPPPPDDWYVIKLKLNTRKGVNGFSPFTTKGGKAFVNVNLEARIIAEGTRAHNQVAFFAINDMVFEETSRLQSLLLALDKKAKKDYTTQGEMMAVTAEALAVEPIVMGYSQWQLDAIVGVDPASGKNIYKTALKGMKHFPKNEDGTYNPSPAGPYPVKIDKNNTVTVELDGTKTAQLVFTRFKKVGA